jgi:hypothetical protein
LNIRVRGRELNAINTVEHSAIENIRSGTPYTDHSDFPSFVRVFFSTVLAIQLDHIGVF